MEQGVEAAALRGGVAQEVEARAGGGGQVEEIQGVRLASLVILI